MTISSMTGFARAEGSTDGLTWAWEAKSVNGRGLDTRLRLPAGYESLELAVRDAVAKRFARGNVSISLAVDRQTTSASLRLNEQVLADVLGAARRVAEITGGGIPDTASLLSLKGVLESNDGAPVNADAAAERERLLLTSLATTLDGLAEARRAEGNRLKQIIAERVADIAKFASLVRASPSRQPAAIEARLKEQIQRLLDTTDKLDNDRLHQEAVIVATRADVEEELARLDAHVAAAGDILAETGAVGRKLDFLAQEFNREANTLCSKANAVEITRLGLQLKTVIDQLREQVQNVE